MSGTWNKAIGANIKRLRESTFNESGKAMSRKDLAMRLMFHLPRKYTRFTVADMEGRRDREIRWNELAALCSIFNVPLWDLVLPPEGVAVDTTVVRGEPSVSESQPDPPTAAVIYIHMDQPGREELAWLLFSVDAKTLDKGVLEGFRRDEQARQHQRLVEIVDKARQTILDELRGEGNGDD
jgi:hypothetical protein